MAPSAGNWRSLVPLLEALALFWVACSTTYDTHGPMHDSLPQFVGLPHPRGFDMGDVVAIFADPAAPPREELKTCSAPFLKLRRMTRSKDELTLGARELVRANPVKAHWCFYSKLLELDDTVRSQSLLEERQKAVLETYEYLAPISRGFVAEFRETRYLRWAVRRYRKLSQWIFFRNVEVTPETTMDLAEAEDPFNNNRPPAPADVGILEKYGLLERPEPPPMAPLVPTAPLPSPLADASAMPMPLAASSPAPGGSPVAVASDAPGVLASGNPLAVASGAPAATPSLAPIAAASAAPAKQPGTAASVAAGKVPLATASARPAAPERRPAGKTAAKSATKPKLAGKGAKK